VHQPHQRFDVARTDVDHNVFDRLQVFLKLSKLEAAQRLRLPFVRIDALDGDDTGARQSWRQQVPRDRRLANVAREADDGEFHGDFLSA